MVANDPDVLSMTPEELEKWMAEIGEPRFRGRQLFEWLWQHGAPSYEDITVWHKSLRTSMASRVPLKRLTAEKVQLAQDGTTKLLLRLHDGNRVETVLLPHPYGYSVCVSSQVGCNMGCHFCASGILGKKRNLSAGEMLDQVRYANQILGKRGQKVSRVDLMGIGEPLDNYDAMVKFLHLLHHPLSFQLSYRHVTVSTSGLVPAIYRLADEEMPVTLAVSLHAPTDPLRLRLMPVNKAYPLSQLIGACRYYGETTGRRVTFEYLMLDGINDSLDNARELVDLVHDFSCHVNLIPWNPVAEHPFKPSPMARVRQFQQLVQDRGISCTIRKELGQEIDAACGQLRRREEEIVR
ncbi:MAG: 23S rRNA (adenine(2503)-C(2))-methyltransferase RlmN [Sulfobacillus benefaciens]|uniref:Probable dual-specificity RNA methyltransferase RlmN n=1 Tax=Sulfobacillus benefaciens TaxID=453960 RepID=A0A2T2XJL6_9FIRM|nr:MAG: 23S rRNA (adenine(2503)-C(2))-methyltransferase RlmN [Sulfobacillus benefaciens]